MTTVENAATITLSATSLLLYFFYLVAQIKMPSFGHKFDDLIFFTDRYN